MDNLVVLIISMIGMLFRLMLIAGAIIIVMVTRKKRNWAYKILYYLGIVAICMLGINFLPALLSLVGTMIIPGCLIALAIFF